MVQAMRITRVFFSFTLFVSLPVSSFFILSHHPLVAQRLDPILTNGTSGHVHQFVGTSAISPEMNADSLKRARESNSCQTSGVGADQSSYWAPSLYNYDETNNTFTSVPHSYTQTYYLQRPQDSVKNKTVVAFPKGLRMIAGNATATSRHPDSQVSKAVSFVCQNYKSGSSQHDHIPAGPCPDGLRTQIVFPSCWDGKNLDSPDHQSHMSYPNSTTPDNGNCPSSHPIKLVTLFYEFVWSTGSQTNPNNSRWVLANGDAMGYTFHADFMNGWHVPTLQKALDQCTDQLFNNLEKCPPLVPTLNRKASQSCSVKPLIKEKVEGTLKRLPGCNPIKNGPNKGKGSGSPDCVSTGISPSSSVSNGKSKSPSAPASQTSLSKAQKHHHHHHHHSHKNHHGKKMTKSRGKSRPTAGLSSS